MKLFEKKQIEQARTRLDKAEKAYAEAVAARDTELSELEAERSVLATQFDAGGGIAIAKQIAALDQAAEMVRARRDQLVSAAEEELAVAKTEAHSAQQAVAARAVVADAAKHLAGAPRRIETLAAAATAVRNAAREVCSPLDVGSKGLEREPLLAAAHEIRDTNARAILCASIARQENKIEREAIAHSGVRRVELFDAAQALSPIAPEFLGALKNVKSNLTATLESIESTIAATEAIKNVASTLKDKARNRLRISTQEEVVLSIGKEMTRPARDKATSQALGNYRSARSAKTELLESTRVEFDELQNPKQVVTHKQLRKPADEEEITRAKTVLLDRMGKIIGRTCTDADVTILETFLHATTPEERQGTLELGKRQLDSIRRENSGVYAYSRWVGALSNLEPVKARIAAELNRRVNAEVSATLGLEAAE